MSENYTSEQHFDYSGLVNQSTSRLMAADNELSFVENGEAEKIGSIFKVRGYLQRGNTINTGYNTLGLFNGYKSSTGTKKQIAIVDGVANSDAYTYNPITDIWTPHGLSLTTGAKAEFESFLDGFFMVNFSDVTRWNDLTQWYTTTNVTNAPKARYLKLYLGRLYLFYVAYDGTTYTSRCVYSDLPTGSPYTLTWNNAVNFFDVATDDGDIGRGLEVNANRLLLFKENSLYRYDTNTLYQVPGCPGTTSQRSIVNMQGHTIYYHSSGIWDYDGSSSQLISRKISELIKGVSTKQFNKVCAWARGDHYYCYLGDIYNPNTGFKVDKCLVDYDIAKQGYTWRSIKHNILVWRNYPDDQTDITYDDATVSYDDADVAYNGVQPSEDRTYFGTDNSEIMRFDTGFNYNGDDIPFTVETKDYYLGYPAYWKLMQKIVVFTNYAGKHITVQAKLDDNDWITLGRLKGSISELLFPSGSRCQRIKFRLFESSGSQRFAFEGLDIYFTPFGVKE
jgi:hypothetical protein